MNIELPAYQYIEDCYLALRQSQKRSDQLNKIFNSHTSESGPLKKTALNEKEYLSNPFYKLIFGLKRSNGNVKLAQKGYAPGEVFLCNETYGDYKRNYLEINPLGFFQVGFHYPEIEKKGQVWMSLIPHEIETMKWPSRQAKGNVLTMGLGLGYFAFLASNKDEVTSVDVIENDAGVIGLFNDSILPLFPHKEKVHIIKADAFLYKPEKKYDRVFVDLYHDEDDGLPIYLRLKKQESQYLSSGGRFDYWIEKSLLCYLRRYVVSLLKEEKDGSKDEDYPETGDFEDDLFSHLHYLLKDKDLRNPSDVEALLSDPSLASIAKKI